MLREPDDAFSYDKIWRERMGGLGSGGHNRKHAGTIEAARRLSAMHLKRRCLLEDATVGSVSWSTDSGETMGSISVHGGRDQIRLQYRVRANGDDWRAVEQSIDVDWMARNFGGEQPFLICPTCGVRFKELCLVAHRFNCSRCSRLVYASSRERESDRARRRAMKLRKRLGTSLELEAPITRPKRMRHARFNQIFDEIIRKEAESWDDCLALLERIKRSNTRRHRQQPDNPPRSQRTPPRFW